MKKLILAATLVFAGAVMATAQTQPPTPAPPQVKFNETTHTFGDIPQGTPVTTVFTFVNEGSAPITIATATPSCGCTVPQYSKDPVAPKEKGEIKVTYNAAAVSNFDKNVTVKFQGDSAPVVLHIVGRVLPKQ